MQDRAKILLPLALVAGLGLGAIVLLDDPEPLPGPDPAVTAQVETESQTPPASPLSGSGPEVMKMTPRADAPPPLTDAQSGMISGRIALSTRILDRFRRYTIIVQEDVNTNGRDADAPKRFEKAVTFKADLSRGTPYFDIPDIPFSKHPYKVSVAAEGMNGSSGHVYITADSPRGKGDVQLSLTPGSYFSVVLRDQRGNPRPGLQVRMVPIGESFVHRDTPRGETSRAGYVLFENVLKGDYMIYVGSQTAPLAPPKKVQVFASFARFSPEGKPNSQGMTIVVPDGETVTIEVISRFGYGVEDAQIKFWQLEVQRYHEFTGATDRGGRAEFENIPYGKYQINVRTKHNGIKDVKFVVAKDKPAPVVRLNMPK